MPATLEAKGIEVLGDWYPIIGDLFISDRMKMVIGVLNAQKRKEVPILPDTKTIFEVFKELAFDDLQGVILTDEPYNTTINIHRAIAVDDWVPYIQYPLELSNFMWEWESTVDEGNFAIYDDPNLGFVHDSGILLLNASLTTVFDKPYVHRSLWDWFVAGILQRISQKKDKIGFLFLGSYAHKFSECVYMEDREHTIVEAPSLDSHHFLGSDCLFQAFPFINP